MSEYTKPGFVLAGVDLALIIITWTTLNKKISELEKKLENTQKEMKSVESYMKYRTPTEKIRALEERLLRLERPGQSRQQPLWDQQDDEDFDPVEAVISQTRGRG